MAESPEHRFLSEVAANYFTRAANTQLFSLLESERKRFDLTCTLRRDWTRPIVGQILWRHIHGVDKDLRTMLLDPEAEVCLYVAADSTKARAQVAEIIGDYRRGGTGIPLYKLRTVWVPADLDFDIESHRELASSLIDEQLTTDVLINVVLGNPTAESIRHFSASSGIVGLELAILWVIASEGFVNMPRLSDRIGHSSSTLNERITRLVGCGFLTQPDPSANYFYASLRGRVFLELCARLMTHWSAEPETCRLFRLLSITNDEHPDQLSALGNAVLLRVQAAVSNYSIDLNKISYYRYWESPAWPPHLPRPQGFQDS